MQERSRRKGKAFNSLSQAILNYQKKQYTNNRQINATGYKPSMNGNNKSSVELYFLLLTAKCSLEGIL